VVDDLIQISMKEQMIKLPKSLNIQHQQHKWRRWSGHCPVTAVVGTGEDMWWYEENCQKWNEWKETLQYLIETYISWATRSVVTS